MTNRGTHTVLLWLERVLLLAGVALAAWSIAGVVQARYYARLPIPPPTLQALPGDAGSIRPVRTTMTRGSWVGRLEAPTVGLAATVLEGSDDRTLARAAGRIEETALPGERGNLGIAGHRDTTFRPLREIAVGAPLRLTTSQRVFEYRVAWTRIVNPEDVYVLAPSAEPTLTLVTCYPFTYIGEAPKRFIVTAELVRETARTAGDGPAAPGRF